jgi:hypothetical protein
MPIGLPPMENSSTLHLVALRLDKDPQQCDEVVRETQEYRNRPLTTPVPVPPPGENFNPNRRIQYALDELKQLVKDLCFRAGMWRADEMLSAAAADWFGRNAVVFLTETVSPEGDHPGWMQSSTMAAPVYCCVLEELVADIKWLRNEGEKGFHQKWMKMGKRHAFKASMALHAAAVFVSPLPCSDEGPL